MSKTETYADLKIGEADWKDAEGMVDIEIESRSLALNKRIAKAIAESGVQITADNYSSSRKVHGGKRHTIYARAEIKGVRSMIGNLVVDGEFTRVRNRDDDSITLWIPIDDQLRREEIWKPTAVSNSKEIMEAIRVDGKPGEILDGMNVRFSIGDYGYLIFMHEDESLCFIGAGSGGKERDVQFGIPEGTDVDAAVAMIHEWIESDMEHGVGGWMRKRAA